MADTLITGTTLVEKESRSIGDVPIGGIVAWAKTLTGVPNLAEGWVECDGQVLSDALSSLNGVTIPDLNGTDLFLRGNNTSGGTGGATTANHSHDEQLITDNSGNIWFDDDVALGASDSSNIKITTSASASGTQNHSKTGNTAPAIIPPFYSVVWIMRVR